MGAVKVAAFRMVAARMKGGYPLDEDEIEVRSDGVIVADFGKLSGKLTSSGVLLPNGAPLVGVDSRGNVTGRPGFLKKALRFTPNDDLLADDGTLMHIDDGRVMQITRNGAPVSATAFGAEMHVEGFQPIFHRAALLVYLAYDLVY